MLDNGMRCVLVQVLLMDINFLWLMFFWLNMVRLFCLVCIVGDLFGFVNYVGKVLWLLLVVMLRWLLGWLKVVVLVIWCDREVLLLLLRLVSMQWLVRLLMLVLWLLLYSRFSELFEDNLKVVLSELWLKCQWVLVFCLLVGFRYRSVLILLLFLFQIGSIVLFCLFLDCVYVFGIVVRVIIRVSGRCRRVCMGIFRQW